MEKRKISIILVCILIMTVIFTGCSKGNDLSVETTKEEDAETRDTVMKYGSENRDVSRSSKADDLDATGVTEDQEIFDIEVTESSINTNEIMIGDSYKMTDSSAILNSVERDKAYGYQYDGLYPNTEEYTKIFEKGFMDTLQSPLSTFSIDVDTASYANIRKNINYGLLPEMDAVRIEEMLNYFNYEYDEPTGKNPFSINTEIGRCPWNQDNYLLMVGVQGKDVDKATLPKSNLVFLIDVSGSMDQEDKLPLLKNAFSQLVEQLTEDDRVSIVVYASKSGVVLDSVPGNEKRIILSALKDLTAGGSTAGAGGIEKAYALAQENFIAGGNNRVILATDGDFNVGPSSPKELEELIEQKRESGIFLSVLGFGMGNIKDNRMELLADKGNGNYAYIDSSMEAKKVLVDEMSGTLLTIAKDVKIQLEFNPYSVESYRLIGYENRALNNEDFKNDKVDAGELGAGHSVTAIYEIVPNRKDSLLYGRESLKYQTKEQVINKEYQDEITEVRLRYKLPDSNKSNEILQVVSYDNTPVNKIYLSEDFYFAAAVAEFGMLLRNSEYKGTSSIENLLMLAEKGLGKDEDGYRTEFINLVEKYEELINNRW